MSRNRSWCIVINNPTPSDVFGLKNLFNTKAEYGICGCEVGEKGTPHLQGYVRLSTPLSLQALKKSLPRANLQVSNGTDLQNKTYCSKDGNILIEVGTMSEQGKRNDIKEIATLIKNKEITLEDLMFEYPEMYVKYSRSFEKMFNSVMEVRTTPPEVHWRFGKAGTGKTRYCVEKHVSHYIKDNTSWWDGYNQQEAIIIDDFDNDIPYRPFLRILDRYIYSGQVKGSYVQVNSPYIYITCEHPPDHYWQGNELQQVLRRITSVQEIK